MVSKKDQLFITIVTVIVSLMAGYYMGYNKGYDEGYDDCRFFVLNEINKIRTYAN